MDLRPPLPLSLRAESTASQCTDRAYYVGTMRPWSQYYELQQLKNIEKHRGKIQNKKKLEIIKRILTIILKELVVQFNLVL